MKRHDAVNPDKGIELTDMMVHALGYADDAVIILEDGSTEGVHQVVSIVNAISAISKESKNNADMFLNVDKTVVMHVKNQDKVSPLTQEEA